MAKRNHFPMKRTLVDFFFAVCLLALLLISVFWPKRNLVNEWQEKKGIEGEILAWEKVLAKHPGFRDAHLRLAVLYWQIKNETNADKHLQMAKELDPNFTQTKKLEEILK